MAIPDTAKRKNPRTSAGWNERMERSVQNNILYYSTYPEKIDARLEALGREWSMERVLEANAAALTAASVVLGIFSGRRWLVLPAVIAGLLLQHSIQGWSPPLSVLRRFGVRNQSEIDRERYALKALRGDFRQLGGGENESEENVLHILRAVK